MVAVRDVLRSHVLLFGDRWGLGRTERMVRTPGVPWLFAHPLFVSLSRPPCANFTCRPKARGQRGREGPVRLPEPLTMPLRVSPSKPPLPLLAGSSRPVTPRRRWWCSGTGRGRTRTCWATTWTAVWQGPTSGSRATTSPSATTGAVLGSPGPPPGGHVREAEPGHAALAEGAQGRQRWVWEVSA